MSNTVYVSYNTYGGCSREASTDDDWDRGDTWTNWNFDEIFYNTKPEYGYSCLSYTDHSLSFNKGDKVYVVIVVWSSGDSFGHDAGAYSEIFFVGKDLEEAEKVKSLIEGGGSTRDELVKKLYGDLKIAYLPWEGYFESLDYVVIMSDTVKGD